MSFKIQIEPEVHQDIQGGIDWYNKQQPGLGQKFHLAVKTHFKKLKINPYYQIRYKDIRCFPIAKYPYMIHYSISEAEEKVIIRAIISTHRDPGIWKKRK